MCFQVYIDLNPLLLPQPGQRPVSLATDSCTTPLPITGKLMRIFYINFILAWLILCSQVIFAVLVGGGNVMSGWLPVYDTMHGIRGEVHIIVKVELFSDLNKFRQSSCGVQFFCSMYDFFQHITYSIKIYIHMINHKI